MGFFDDGTVGVGIDLLAWEEGEEDKWAWGSCRVAVADADWMGWVGDLVEARAGQARFRV